MHINLADYDNAGYEEIKKLSLYQMRIVIAYREGKAKDEKIKAERVQLITTLYTLNPDKYPLKWLNELSTAQVKGMYEAEKIRGFPQPKKKAILPQPNEKENTQVNFNNLFKPLSGYSVGPISLDDLMSPKTQQKTGVNKLTALEKVYLESWVRNAMIGAVKETEKRLQK